MTETISPDYLVIGAGAMGMAFVDTLISEKEATVAIVDRYSRPGGHWTLAYPFVTLHQPSDVWASILASSEMKKSIKLDTTKALPRWQRAMRSWPITLRS